MVTSLSAGVVTAARELSEDRPRVSKLVSLNSSIIRRGVKGKMRKARWAREVGMARNCGREFRDRSALRWEIWKPHLEKREV